MISVTAICLTADRQVYTERAIRCFLAQDYTQKSLVILDSGKTAFELHQVGANLILARVEHQPTDTIGRLRNLANSLAVNTDLICHWDSDDWSAPNRISEQVKLIQTEQRSGIAEYPDLVGCNEMLFWNSVKRETWRYKHPHPSYCVGTSMMYRREAWEAVRFDEAITQGEDHKFWMQGVPWYKRAAMSSVPKSTEIPMVGVLSLYASETEPLIIAELHGGNTCAKTDKDKREWTREEQWDKRVSQIMAMPS